MKFYMPSTCIAPTSTRACNACYAALYHFSNPGFSRIIQFYRHTFPCQCYILSILLIRNDSHLARVLELHMSPNSLRLN